MRMRCMVCIHTYYKKIKKVKKICWHIITMVIYYRRKVKRNPLNNTKSLKKLIEYTEENKNDIY